MAVKRIPAREEITCDVCGRLIDGSVVHRKYNARVILKMDGLDYQGCAVADATESDDLCDYCLVKVKKALDAVKSEIRASTVSEKP